MRDGNALIGARFVAEGAYVFITGRRQAQLDEANASLGDAEREYNRQVALWKQGVTSKALLDGAEARLKAARARVDQIRINMGDMVVRAPFDGTIATKNTEVGEVISSVTLGQVSGTLPAGAICTIVDLNTLEVEADVNESNIGQIHEGQPAEVTVDLTGLWHRETRIAGS